MLVSCVHKRGAAYSDVVAQKLLKANHVRQDLCDPEFDERTVERAAAVHRNSIAHSHLITHIGTGQGKVEMVASNRRYVTPDGKVSWEEAALSAIRWCEICPRD